jgi:Arc/MetJ-type ribon-helix-helix transcriptional regulator
MKKFDTLVCVKLHEKTVSRMDVLIEKNKFDSRSGIARRAIEELLEREEHGKTIVS